MDTRDTGYKVNQQRRTSTGVREMREKETEGELGLPRFDSLACASSTHHGFVNIHNIHRFSLSRVLPRGGV